jgi:hypothetical protein
MPLTAVHAPGEPTPSAGATPWSALAFLAPSLLHVLALGSGVLATILFAIGPATPARWFAATVGAALVPLLVLLRPFYLGWGATDDELRRPLPGDDLLGRDAVATTRAITIAARPAAIWPWLMRVERGRLAVAAVQADRLLALRGHVGGTAVSWSFVLVPIDAESTRLVVRLRAGRRWRGLHALIELSHFLLERKLLLGIRERAEVGARA